MGLFDLFGSGGTFDFDGDGETCLFDAFVALGWFNIYSEYCDLKEQLRELQSGKSDDDDD